MTNLLIYAIMVTLMSYAILAAYFDGHVFIGIRTVFYRLQNHSVITKDPLGYFIGYLFTCYFCSSFWVSWLVAYGTYGIVFTEDLGVLSASLIIFGTGLFSVAVLDLLSYVVIKEEIEFGAFFPWNDPGYREVSYEDEEGQKIAAKFDDSIYEEAVSEPDKEPDKEPDISDSVEDTIDNPVVDTDSPTEISKENE